MTQCSRILVQNGKTPVISHIDLLSFSFLRKLGIEDGKRYCLTCFQFIDLVIKAASKENAKNSAWVDMYLL